MEKTTFEKKTSFNSKFDVNMRNKILKSEFETQILIFIQLTYFGKLIRTTLKVLEYGNGER